MVINRRQFVCAAAGAVLGARPVDLAAQAPDLVVRGGRGVRSVTAPQRDP